MKKLIFGVGLVLTVSVINLFNACSADETEEAYMEQTSKKELLLAKSKEFAKKYGVNMTLRKDKLDDIVQRMTIKDMEKYFMLFATMKEKPLIISFDSQKKQHRKTLKFRTTTNTTEEDSVVWDNKITGSETKEVTFEAKAYDYINSEYFTRSFSGEITISWKYALTSDTFVRISTNGLSSSDGTQCSGGGTLFPSWGANKEDFEASGEISFSDNSFNYRVYANVSRSNGNLSVSFTTIN